MEILDWKYWTHLTGAVVGAGCSPTSISGVRPHTAPSGVHPGESETVTAGVKGGTH